MASSLKSNITPSPHIKSNFQPNKTKSKNYSNTPTTIIAFFLILPLKSNKNYIT